MNYYPFHIGDYVCATRHLSWEEDAAYRRLLDTYYTTEKPLPLDEKKVFRLVLANSKTQREAVLSVLSEFFSHTDDGWVNERAQKEIEEMRAKQEAIEKKNAHETDRMRRHRERRAVMFEALRSLGIVPAYDIPMTELQRLFDANCNGVSNAPATHLQREQVVFGDAPATAIPTPTPTPTPTPKKREAKASSSAAKLPTCPYNNIVGLYHEILPELPGVRVMDKDRETAILEFWTWVLTTNRPDGTPRASTADDAIAWTRDYMSRARDNDFIMGRGPRSPDHPNWRCTIEYLLSTRGMKRVIEETRVAA